jgi:hypothetical protein
MQIEVLQTTPPSVRLTLVGDEPKYLRMALERATFQDTPPGEQRAIYNFSDSLLKELENLKRP